MYTYPVDNYSVDKELDLSGYFELSEFELMRFYCILSVTSHVNCIVARYLLNVVYLTACAVIRS